MLMSNSADIVVRALSASETEQVSGGLKWMPGTQNDDVIDARGDSMKFFGGRIIVDFDINGNYSGVRVI